MSARTHMQSPRRMHTHAISYTRMRTRNRLWCNPPLFYLSIQMHPTVFPPSLPPCRPCAPTHCLTRSFTDQWTCRRPRGVLRGQCRTCLASSRGSQRLPSLRTGRRRTCAAHHQTARSQSPNRSRWGRVTWSPAHGARTLQDGYNGNRCCTRCSYVT